VSHWVPEVKGFGARISVRQLLSHTSGIPDRYALHDAQIFAPLGMTRTRWREDHRVVVADRASACSQTRTGEYRNEHPFTRVFGSGGLLLTIDDFLKWSNALQNGAGAWGAVRDSLQAVVHLNDGTALTYGLGLVTEQWRGVRRVSHTGATGGYRAVIYRFPQQAVSFALLCNVTTANTTTLSNSVASIVLGDVLQPVAAPVTPAIAMTADAATALAGRYRAPRTDEVMVLEARNGQLTDSLSGTTLLPAGSDQFRMRGGDGVLKVVRTGTAIALRTEAPNARAADCSRAEMPLPSNDAYAGSYRSAELDATLTLTVRDGALRIEDGFRGTRPLAPLFRDGFSLADGERIRFTRDARGRVDGALLWAGRVRHLRFTRAATSAR
jgi:hypothetical protein